MDMNVTKKALAVSLLALFLTGCAGAAVDNDIAQDMTDEAETPSAEVSDVAGSEAGTSESAESEAGTMESEVSQAETPGPETSKTGTPEYESQTSESDLNIESEAESITGDTDAAVDTYTAEPLSDAALEFWNGYWFGWWELEAAVPFYEQLEGYKLTVLGKSSLTTDGQVSISLWDNDYDIADVSGTNNGSGLTGYGTFVSDEGFFWNGDSFGEAVWTIDPGEEPHDGYIRIDGTNYSGGYEIFNYTIHLVKWGYSWDDFDDDLRPDEYDWYIGLIDNGVDDH